MEKRRKNARWSYKDHGFVNDVKNGCANYPIIYFTWRNMAERTNSPCFQAKRPTYKGTWVCEEWKYFSNFLNWSLANGYRKGLCLDKDIININNKCYSPDACVFVSNAVNVLLTYKKAPTLIFQLELFIMNLIAKDTNKKSLMKFNLK
jgi:hypothetical protein